MHTDHHAYEHILEELEIPAEEINGESSHKRSSNDTGSTNTTTTTTTTPTTTTPNENNTTTEHQGEEPRPKIPLPFDIANPPDFLKVGYLSVYLPSMEDIVGILK